MGFVIRTATTIIGLDEENLQLDSQISSCESQAQYMQSVSCASLGLKAGTFEEINNRMIMRSFIIRTHSLAYEAIKSANIANLDLLDALPDSPGTPGVLDCNHCEKKIESLKLEIANLEKARDILIDLLKKKTSGGFATDWLITLAVESQYSDLITAKGDEIAYLESLIEKANQYDRDSSSTYSNAQKLIRDALHDSTTAIKECIKNGYYPNDYLSQATQQQEFFDDLKKHYGFDLETALALWDVWLMLGIKNPNASKEELDWLYTRAVSMLVYNEGDNLDDQWRAGAGYVYEYGEEAEEEYFLSLGLTKAQYELLRYKVRVQNQISSNPEGYKPENVKSWNGSVIPLNNTQLVGDRYDLFKESMEKGLGKKLTDEEFDRLWKEQFDSFTTKETDGTYKGKADYAHMLYTIAGGCVAEDADGLKDDFPPFPHRIGTGNMWKNHEGRKDYIGWLGDATFTGIENTGVSFGPEDYIADLDAENIRRRMQDKKQNYLQASAEYFNEMEENNQLRTEEFKEHHPYEDVKNAVLEAAGVSSVDELIDDWHKVVWSDAYDFLMSLRDDEPTLQPYS